MGLGAKTIGGALLICAIAMSSAYAQRRDERRGGDDNWERLGCEDIGRRTDRDEIKVGRREGRFSAIRLEAKGNDVNILGLKVIYDRGDPDDIRVRSEIREDTQTGPLDLRGRDRAIDRIEIIAKRDFKGRGRGKAQICVYGRKAEDRRDDRTANKWEELGCQSVGLLGDRDTIKVGRREGRFKAIKLNVSGNAVHIMDLKVIYSNGDPDDIQVRSEIREGGETRPLDLRGRARTIDRIELVYRAKPNFPGQGWSVCHGPSIAEVRWAGRGTGSPQSRPRSSSGAYLDVSSVAYPAPNISQRKARTAHERTAEANHRARL